MAPKTKPVLRLVFTAGWDIYSKEQRSIGMQVQGENLLDRVNLLDFAGLFRRGSGCSAQRFCTATVFLLSFPA